MDDKIRLLQEKFKQIKEQGYIKSVRKGSTGVGATFEYLIGKNEENFELPDFYGIEIKTKRAYSKSKISLFNAKPTGSNYYETKRLRDEYGYPSKKDKNLKRLYAQATGNEISKVGLWYYFKIKVDRVNKKLVLQVFNYKQDIIDESTYWDFDILEEKLLRKTQVVAIVKAWTNNKDNAEYFKYYKMNIYILKNFSIFLDMIETGKIFLIFKIDSFVDEKRYGKVDSHGISFELQENNLLQLYELYR